MHVSYSQNVKTTIMENLFVSSQTMEWYPDIASDKNWNKKGGKKKNVTCFWLNKTSIDCKGELPKTKTNKASNMQIMDHGSSDDDERK